MNKRSSHAPSTDSRGRNFNRLSRFYPVSVGRLYRRIAPLVLRRFLNSHCLGTTVEFDVKGSMSRTAPPETAVGRANEEQPVLGHEEALQSLLLRGLDGDATSYRQFLTAVSSYLRRMLTQRPHIRHADIEEMVQEAIRAIHRARHSYRSSVPLSVWIHAITWYKLAGYLRDNCRHDELKKPSGDATELLSACDPHPARAETT